MYKCVNFKKRFVPKKTWPYKYRPKYNLLNYVYYSAGFKHFWKTIVQLRFFNRTFVFTIGCLQIRKTAISMVTKVLWA